MVNLFNKVFGTIDIVWGLSNQGFEDFGKLLGHTIGDRPTTRHYRPEGSVWFVDLGEAIKLGGTHPVGYMDL